MENEAVDFKEILGRFENNIHSIRVFSEQIGAFAEQHDSQIIQSYNDDLSRLLGVERSLLPDNVLPERVSIVMKVDSGITDSQPNETVDNSLKENAPSSIDGAVELTEQLDDGVVVALSPNEGRIAIKEITSLLKTLKKSSPHQGRLLRQGALITLISFFEALISELIQGYYLEYPSALPAEERILSLSDLREIGSIEEAEKHLVAREVESVLRGSFKSQLDYFSKRFKIKILLVGNQLDLLVEIFQRRNLLVHNQGIVNRTYFANVENSLVDKFEAEEGKSLSVSTDYLEQAIDVIYLCGNILTQQCWRKWKKSEQEKADAMVMLSTYDGLLDERYELVNLYSSFCSGLDFSDDQVSRLICINHAIALKELGKYEEMNLILDERDWSACAMRFHVALHALRDEVDELFTKLPLAVAAEEIDEDALLNWPLFRPYRESIEYRQILEDAFLCDGDDDDLIVESIPSHFE
mgnify:CR=1 FL=1